MGDVKKFSSELISMSDYGVDGMPKIVVLGCKTRKVFFNENSSSEGIKDAIDLALVECATSGIISDDKKIEDINLTIYPNPVSQDLTSYQFISSHLFKTNNNKDTVSILSDTLRSDYLFFRTDYGLSEKLTMSVALGYFLDKSIVNRNESYSVSGVSDLILFPRYNVFNFKKENHRTELTLGLGLKLPIGSHTDSSLLVTNPIFGDIYAYNPPIAQLTNGSQDAMFYAFIFRTYPKKKFSVFANSLFIKKAFNSLGEKFGDYSSMSVFFSKSLPKNFGLTAQLKYEHVGEIEAAHGVELVNYNVELESTGLSKMLFVPQLSYSKNGFTYFATADLPLF